MLCFGSFEVTVNNRRLLLDVLRCIFAAFRGTLTDGERFHDGCFSVVLLSKHGVASEYRRCISPWPMLCCVGATACHQGAPFGDTDTTFRRGVIPLKSGGYPHHQSVVCASEGIGGPDEDGEDSVHRRFCAVPLTCHCFIHVGDTSAVYWTTVCVQVFD